MTDVSLETRQAEHLGPGNGATLSVLAETAYPESVASARVRVCGFVTPLRAARVALHYRPALSDQEYSVVGKEGRIASKAASLGRASARAVLRRRPEHDLLLVHRVRLLNPLPGFDPPRALDVYDLDDPLFVPFPGGVNQRFRWTKQEVRRSLECLRRARLVLAGNPYLASRAREHAKWVEVLPSCVDPDEQPLHVHHTQPEVRVGWIGSPTTSPYLDFVFPVFERLNASGLKAKLVLVGADPRLAAPWIEHHPWSLLTQREHLASFDIGIMPQPDDEWARGKCGYKVLQYFAAGVPAVASPVGITRELIGTERGVLASSADDWYRALVTLIENPAQRAEQGAAAREYVQRRYSYVRWAPELARLLHALAD